MKEVHVIERRQSVTPTPQALAWDGEHFWVSSRDLGTLYKVDRSNWNIVAEVDPPGVVWAATATDDGMCFTIGKGLNDNRFVYGYIPNDGFHKLCACPEFIGSYLSFDGKHLYLSQWYKGLILKLDRNGSPVDEISLGEEICGHTFVDGNLYVLGGSEQNGESWHLARLPVRDKGSRLQVIAIVPFASRSLAFDGEKFWSNHRAGNETIAFLAE